MEVLNGAQGVAVAPSVLRRVFRNRFQRNADRWGYVRFRHWRLYSEIGLARETVCLWLTRQTLTVEYEDVPLAHYGVAYQPDRRHFTEIQPLHFFETSYTPPRLLSVAGVEWAAVKRLEPSHPQTVKTFVPPAEQLSLFED